MTKPIIINGVDVSECCYFEKENAPYYCTLYENECEAQNCYFQQLKRKEQECEKYKSSLNDIKIIIKDLLNDLCNNCGWHNTDSCAPEDYVCGSLIKIKQIINEVENGINN